VNHNPATITVRLGPRSYNIAVGKGLLPGILSRSPLLRDRPCFVIADRKLHTLTCQITKNLGSRLAGSLYLKGGEPSKQMGTMGKLYEAAARARLDRRSCVIAIGGGVIGDAAGFFAATYLRGLPIIHVPTTLVAQVDSAIGGKTGVNLPSGKNLVGAFHQPMLVVVDTATLTTLPAREFRAGLAEVIKSGVIADSELFGRLEKNLTSILRKDAAELAWIVKRCCAIKADVVSRDERELTGLRAILNFGHTIGHGIEAAAKYSLLHGEAVALGMIGASLLSMRISKFPVKEHDRLLDLIRRTGLPTRLPVKYKPAEILKAMRLDKKVANGQLRFVLATKIGKVKTGIPVAESLVLETIRELQR
jgi:3-dehydroquinate synthase